MALVQWWRGIGAADGEVVFVFRVDADATPSVSIGNEVFAGDAIVAANNGGIGAVRCTGLSAGTYSASLRLDGVAVGTADVVVRSSDVAVIAGASCASFNIDTPAFRDIATRHGADVFHAMGDWPYSDNPTSGAAQSAWGYSLQSVLYDGSASNWFDHMHRMWAVPGFAFLGQRAGLGVMPDDHEWGNDWDHSLTVCNAIKADRAADQAAADALWHVGNQVALAYSSGNPPNTDSGADAEKPSEAAAGTAVSNYPARYFRYTRGPVEVFVLDCISHKSPKAATDNASKTMLGANQKAWLKARLSASSAPWKLIVSGKSFWKGTGSNNPDDWAASYTTERDELLDYVETNEIKNVVIMSGDKHMPFVSYHAATGIIEVRPCPLTETRHDDLGVGYATETRWKACGNAGSGGFGAYAVIRFTADNADIGLYDLASQPRFRCDYPLVSTGTNAPQRREIKFAV